VRPPLEALDAQRQESLRQALRDQSFDLAALDVDASDRH